MLHLVRPRRVIDQVLEGFAPFVNLLQIDAVIIAEGVPVNVSGPLAALERQNGVNPRVEGNHLIVVERLLNQEVAAQIKQINFEISEHRNFSSECINCPFNSQSAGGRSKQV